MLVAADGQRQSARLLVLRDLRLAGLACGIGRSLDLVGEGMPTKEIARTLSISPKTVECHRANIRAKLGIDHSAGLIRYASQWRALEGNRA